MTPVLVLPGLILGAWSVRSICIKHHSTPRKVITSIIAAGYFLLIGGLGAEEDKFTPALVWLLIGAGIQLYANRK